MNLSFHLHRKKKLTLSGKMSEVSSRTLFTLLKKTNPGEKRNE